MTAHDGTMGDTALSPIEDILEDARAGRMFILVDHEDRENEGDLVIPADCADAEAVNFMALHGRGLICLALEGARVDRLGLPLQAASNSSRHETAFTVSIEAREGVTTGISAADRARTIATAIDPAKGPQDLATPGHVFPLRARDAGVLVRAGHTEAAVDIARLAGRPAAGVICEIMKSDGSMARLPDLVVFAREHGLRIGAISDLIAYRRQHDHLVAECDQRVVQSEYGGEWTLHLFRDAADGMEHIALVKGDLSAPGPVTVRMHAFDPLGDVLGLAPGRGGLLARAMERIAQEGRGAVVFLRDPRASVQFPEWLRPEKVRKFGVGAQILSELGVSRIVLLTNSPMPRYVGLEAFGISIAAGERI